MDWSWITITIMEYGHNLFVKNSGLYCLNLNCKLNWIESWYIFFGLHLYTYALDFIHSPGAKVLLYTYIYTYYIYIYIYTPYKLIRKIQKINLTVVYCSYLCGMYCNDDSKTSLAFPIIDFITKLQKHTSMSSVLVNPNMMMNVLIKNDWLKRMNEW